MLSIKQRINYQHRNVETIIECLGLKNGPSNIVNMLNTHRLEYFFQLSLSIKQRMNYQHRNVETIIESPGLKNGPSIIVYTQARIILSVFAVNKTENELSAS